MTGILATAAGHFALCLKSVDGDASTTVGMSGLFGLVVSAWGVAALLMSLGQLTGALLLSGKFREINTNKLYDTHRQLYVQKLTNLEEPYSEIKAGTIAKDEMLKRIRDAMIRDEESNRLVIKNRMYKFNQGMQQLVAAAVLAIVHGIIIVSDLIGKEI